VLFVDNLWVTAASFAHKVWSLRIMSIGDVVGDLQQRGSSDYSLKEQVPGRSKNQAEHSWQEDMKSCENAY
jgi:hypothetical protein